MLDEAGMREAMEIHERARLEILEVEARSAARLVESGEAGFRASSSQGCFRLPPR